MQGQHLLLGQHLSVMCRVAHLKEPLACSYDIMLL